MTEISDAEGPDPGELAPLPGGMRRDLANAVRPILQALARMIATDRRAVVLANQRGEILLANRSAQQLGIGQAALTARLDWAGACARARRSGSVSAHWSENGQSFEGEVVHVPLGPAEGYLLRLAESDQESTWLRNRARSAMLMRVAHDLRTPIQSLLASADALMKGQGGAGAADDAGASMRRAAELALEHISNVLAVIRGEQNPGGVQPDEDFRIVEEIGNFIALVEPIAAARATEVRLSVDAPPDLTLRGPLRFVRALCQNLIDNSVNHGGGRVELRLSCAPLADPLPGDEPAAEIWRVGIELLDEGGGLPPAQKARLAKALGLPLDPATLPAVPPDKRPSAGLNVLAHALKQLGGRIEIQDRGSDGLPLPSGESGRVIGTVFRVSFSLPRAPDMRRQPMAGPAQDQPVLAGRMLMLVEDSPASRDWLGHLLRSFGAEVVAAGSGPEALAMLSRDELAGRVELVLTDVTLPRMSGIELAARLKAGDPASAARWQGKVVGLTAHADDRIKEACRQAGMVCVLEKPIRPDTLRDALAGILAGNASGQSPGAVPMRCERAALDPVIAADLAERVGGDAARGFMLRALAEAQSVLDELRQEGVGQDTGRRLHAATGASGLTGLALVENRLRAIEKAVEAGQPDLEPLFGPLDEALAQSRRLVEDMA
ncbi:response regulator [Paracoccus sp. P2]|uniref:histidine kinase n=1 Tax=Paracoccus pantotrophus TaxID=82367 RepID=A0A7H9BRX3_PARPN|nr:hybrid sensor histidine kinase/response regulator [Paracoccus pantotrophus]QLH14117.1 response regulator [Paracoccus pantotrophus]